MKHSYKIIIALIAFTIYNINSVFSQNYLAFSSDNYAGATGMLYQPASIVDSRYKFDMEFIGASSQLENNWWSLSNKLIFNPNLISDTNFINQNVHQIQNDLNKNVYQTIEARALTFMVSLGEKSAIGFSARGRQMINIDNIDPDAAALITSANADQSIMNTSLDYQDMSQSAVAFMEYGLTYGQVVLDKKKHFLKAGATVKLLQGMGAVYLYEKNIQYELVAQDSAINVDADVKFGASSNFEDIIDFKFNAKPGFGLDFGFIYEFRPNYKNYKYEMDGEKDLWKRDENKYLFKVSFSVLDLGYMNFEKQFGSNDFRIQEEGFNTEDILSFSLEEFSDSINSSGSVTGNENMFKYKLPTTINLNVDYRIIKHLYVNVNGRLALNQGKEHFSKSHYLNSASITPRYETKWFGISVPLRYNQYRKFNAGLGLRLGPLWIGSNNLLALTGIQDEITSADFYMAIKIPIMYKAPKDTDGDLVSDKLDECDNDKGLLSLKGCPDSDNDGIANKDDKCPYTAGIAEFNGCPDTDGDGIADEYDKCPETAGLKTHQGCPDTDEDGIIDINDSCASIAGLEIYNGCPDTDNDSIPDNLDDCPDTKGLQKFNGCPDTDNDGITDALDLCPEIAGVDSLQGCPYTDTDGDSIQDKYDHCPKIAGPISNHGCPDADTDNDSVPDKDDLCPMTPGLVSNNGCPVIEEEYQEILNTAFSNLEFVTNKAVISRSSYKSLDELAALMIKKAEFRLLIEGYTDNVGKESTNLVLSQKRSLAVKRHLASRGVQTNRMDTKWFGEANPISTNDTKEGREKNRRVELKVIFD